MRTITILASAALTSASFFTSAVMADDRLHLTPPLYRDQARTTQQTRPPSDLTTTPQLVPAASTAGRGKVSSANKVMVEAAAR